MISTLLMAASLGLLSTLHCWGMCGSLVAALQIGIPAPLRTQRKTRLILTACYQVGRVTAYTLLGVLSAGMMAWPGALHPQGFRILQTLAAVSVVIAGLRLGGWFRQWRLLEVAGAQVWRRLAPLARALMPVDHPAKALANGLLWGLIPCGLVYAMVPVAAATGSAAAGALCMLAFGLGTLPGMLAASLVASFGATGFNLGSWRKPAGAAMVGLALTWWLIQGLPTLSNPDHSAHLHHVHAMPH